MALGARALDLLIALTERAGEVVSKEELMARGWPGTYVEDSNIRVHIAGLRRALHDGEGGKRFIVNVPGRGYSFVAAVQRLGRPATGPPRESPDDRRTAFPLPLSRLIGRTAIVEALCAQLAQRRFVTLVGPGGIGKTTVALAVARELYATYADGAVFVDLSPTSNPDLVPGVVATALGLAVPVQDAIPAVAAFLRQKRILVVLDNCEHLIEAATIAAEQISSAGPGVHVLATSREPLRAAGERVHRLPPLESPSASEGLTAAEALTFPGIQLFVERADESMGGFVLSDGDAPIVADICRRLDGMALAIELAASRVAAFGVRELAVRLDDRFRLLTSGRRTALPRHQTLAATLDWSFELLSDAEQTLMRRMSVFAGEFSLEAVGALMRPSESADVMRHVPELVGKSLVVADSRDEGVSYRLLETTRLYGREKLRMSDELERVRRAHARYMLRFYETAEADSETMASSRWLATYVSQIANLRAALDWAASDIGDPDLLVALTAAAVPLWVQLSLISECRTRVQRALASVGDDTSSPPRLRMRLCAALGWSSMYATGRSDDIGTAWGTTLELAEQLDDQSYRVRALWGVWMSKLNTGDLASALGWAEQMLDRVSRYTDATDLMLADRLMATTLHYRGDQRGARTYIERMLSRYSAQPNQPRIARFHVDQQVTARYFQARIVWLQGYPDQASQVVARNLEEGSALGHALSFASVLGQGACPISLFTGDLAAARQHGLLLAEHSTKHGLRLWQVWAECFNGLVSIKEGDVETGLRAMRAAFDQAGDSRFLPRYMVLLGEFGAALGRAGEVSQGVATLDGILARCSQSEECWYVAELLRLKGELLLLSDGPRGEAVAEELFDRAVDLGRRQDARSWQLRSAMSLARLRRAQGRASEARPLLSGIYAGFSEGFATSDLKAAAALLSEL